MMQSYSIWKKIDWVIILIYVLMVIAGWLNIYSAVYDDQHKSIFDMSQRYGKQLLWIGCAFFMAILILASDSKFFVTFSYLIFGIFIFLLLVVLPFGSVVNGSKSWFMFGGFGFQPSEFSKFGTSLALAKLVSSYNFNLKEKKTRINLLIILLVPVLLILLQHDVGSALVYFVFLFPLFREGLSGLILFFLFLIIALFVITLVLQPAVLVIALVALSFLAYYLIRRNWNEILTGALIFVGSTILVGIFYIIFKEWPIDFYYILLRSSLFSAIVILVISIYRRIPQAPLVSAIFLISMVTSFTVDFVFDNLLKQHHRDRINNLLGIESDLLGAGWNVHQSKIAIGSGGFLGKGFLHGTQTKYNFVPEQSTDFIFCTVGEEWGFVGTTILVLGFVFLLYRIIKLSERQKSTYSRVYGYCVASIIFFHFAINIGMTIGLVPVIGIPLPFFSYGGSSLWFFTILLFVLLSLDKSRFEQLH